PARIHQPAAGLQLPDGAESRRHRGRGVRCGSARTCGLVLERAQSSRVLPALARLDGGVIMLESPALYMEIQALQAKEVGLLQAGRYDEWLELFTPDVRYWMPVVYVEDRRDAESPRHDLGHFDHDMRTL